MLDLSLGNLMRHLYFRQVSGVFYQSNHAFNETRAKALIFGSSRANHHYIPGILEDSLELSCFNAGRDGQGIFYSLALQRAILGRYKPELMILDLNLNEFLEDSESYDRLSALLPYLKNHPEIKDIVRLKSRTESIRMISQVYPFNGTLLTLVANLPLFAGKTKKAPDGYLPLYGSMEGRNPGTGITGHPADPVKVKCFEEFLENAAENGIRLVVAVSPYYADFQDPLTPGFPEELCLKYGAVFLDYSREKEFLDHPGLFADVFHLNDAGANRFTEKLAMDLKNVPGMEKNDQLADKRDP